MDNPTTTQSAVNLPKSGIYVRGVVISNRADCFRRKDGSGMVVKVTHEIALQPGVVIWERYFDPVKDNDLVSLLNDRVSVFPKLEEFSPLALRVDRFKADGEKFVLTSAAIVH